jgi:exopolysaccharide biosynthesis polyprenyl glycosylphosphotransferase
MTPPMIQFPVARFTSLVAESVLAFLCFAMTLHYACQNDALLMFALPRHLAIETLLASLLFVAVWMMLFFDLRQQQLQRMSFNATVRATLFGLAILTPIAVLIFRAFHANWSITTIVARFWLWSVLLTIAVTIFNFALRRLFMDSDHNVLIIGTGPIARRAWREIRTRHSRSFRVIGFTDTSCFASAPSDIRANYLGDITELESLLLKHSVDLMVLALPVRSCYDVVREAVTTARMGGIDLISLSDPLGFDKQTLFGSGTLFEPTHTLHTGLSKVAKRTFDMISSLLALIVLSPLLLAVAVAVKLSSPGPVFFIQDRYGYRRQKLRLLKFRTMVQDAEILQGSVEHLNEASGPIFKIKNDPRVTTLGKFLRKTSIDELPQLWNVFLGEMSLVGPRPMTLRDVSLFNEAYLLRRFSAKPGITGLWQVSGRSNLTFDQWIALDFSYIDQWSLALDMQILLATIPAIVRGSGAM